MWIIFAPAKTLLKSSKSCGCEIFRVFRYLLSIFLLYTHLCRMILSKQKCCLLLNGVSTEIQKLCTSDTAGFFSNKKYDSYTCWTCTVLCEAFTSLIDFFFSLRILNSKIIATPLAFEIHLYMSWNKHQSPIDFLYQILSVG